MNRPPLPSDAALADAILTRRPDALAVYLYGSAAVDAHTAHSDLDLALLLPGHAAKALSPLQWFELQGDLAELWSCEVDLVDMRSAPTVLQKEIIENGRRIATRDRDSVEGFEALVLSLYGKLNEERAGILEAFRATGKAYDA